jgi:hypothetical protein
MNMILLKTQGADYLILLGAAKAGRNNLIRKNTLFLPFGGIIASSPARDIAKPYQL